MHNGRSKYGSIKVTTSDGITHDSQKEANRWCELKLLERAGKITDLQRQVAFELIPAQYESVPRVSKSGKPLKDGHILIEKSVKYIADFVYREEGKIVVEDVKSSATAKKESFIIKRKLLYWVYGIKLKQV
jgi:hypothetical protein